MVEKITKYSALMTFYILLMEFLYLNGYYSPFGINILMFIDYSEILLNALPIITIALPLFSLFFVLVIQDENFHLENQTCFIYLKKYSGKIGNVLSLMILLMILFDFLLNDDFKQKIFPSKNPIWSLLIYTFFFFLFLLFTIKQEKVKFGLNVYILAIGIFCLIISWKYGFENFLSRRSKHNGEGFEKINFNIGSTVYRSDSLLWFIGETKSFIFMVDHRELKNKTRVFKKDNIDSIYYFK